MALQLFGFGGVGTVSDALGANLAVQGSLADDNAMKNYAGAALGLDMLKKRTMQAVTAATKPELYFTTRAGEVEALITSIKDTIFPTQYKLYKDHAFLTELEKRALAVKDCEHYYEQQMKLIDAQYPDNFNIATAKSLSSARTDDIQRKAELFKSLLGH